MSDRPTLSDYYELVANIDGQPPRQPPEGATKKELDFREGAGKEGAATVHFLGGEPLLVEWHEWDLDQAHLLQRLSEEIGGEVKLIDIQGGNGHYRAVLQVNGRISKLLQKKCE